MERHGELLKRMARKYIWWKTPEDTVATPQRVMAQVMDIGASAEVPDRHLSCLSNFRMSR